MVAQMVKNVFAMQETQVWFLGQENFPLDREMATHSSIPAWRISRTEEPGRLQSMGWQRVRHNWSDLVQFWPKDEAVSNHENKPFHIGKNEIFSFHIFQTLSESPWIILKLFSKED